MKRTVHLASQLGSVTLDGLEVITPHRGAARSLGVPPRSLQNLALVIIKAKGYEVAPALTARRALVSTVRDVLGVDDPASMANRMTLPLETVLRIGMDTNALEEFGSLRVQQLARVVKEYQFRLRRQGLMDQSEILWQAAQLAPRRRPLFVYGYYRTRVEELTFLNAIAGDDSVMLLPYFDHPLFGVNREGIEILRRQGWEINAHNSSPHSVGDLLCQRFMDGLATTDLEQVQARAFTDLEAEVRGILTDVKQLVASGAKSDEIVLVARDAKLYGPTLLSVGWEYGLQIRPTYDVPIIETKFGTWMSLFLESITEDFPFEATLRMLVHPLGLGLSTEALRDARARHPGGKENWGRCGVDLSALCWPESDSRENWTRRLISALQELKVRNKSGLWAKELIAFHYFLDEIRSAVGDPEEAISRERFSEEIIETLSFLSIPAQPGAGGIELHEPHTLIGSKYKHVFVLGMSEGITPGPVAENPVVDFYERKRLLQHGIEFENAAAVTRWEALSFYFMLQIGTESFSFSYPRLIESEEKLSSPYFDQLGIEPELFISSSQTASSPEEARRLLLKHGEIACDDLVLMHARFSFAVEQKRDLPGRYDEYDGVVGIPLDPEAHRWSVSQLSNIGRCPFSWFAKKVLNLQTEGEFESSLTPAVRGMLYHKALELALEKAKGSDDLRRAAIENLEESLRQAEKDKSVGLPPLPAWDAQRLEHLMLLRRAIESADFLKTGANVLSIEDKFEGEWYGLKIEGRVDRIDDTSEGLIFIDYKTGSGVSTGVKDDAGKAKIDIQLPIYMQVAAPKLYPDRKVAGAYYYSLSKAKVIKEMDSDEDHSLESFAAKVKSHLSEGSFPIDPDVDQGACRFCDYDSVCRKGYRLFRKMST